MKVVISVYYEIDEFYLFVTLLYPPPPLPPVQLLLVLVLVMRYFDVLSSLRDTCTLNSSGPLARGTHGRCSSRLPH